MQDTWDAQLDDRLAEQEMHMMYLGLIRTHKVDTFAPVPVPAQRSIVLQAIAAAVHLHAAAAIRGNDSQPKPWCAMHMLIDTCIAMWSSDRCVKLYTSMCECSHVTCDIMPKLKPQNSGTRWNKQGSAESGMLSSFRLGAGRAARLRVMQ